MKKDLKQECQMFGDNENYLEIPPQLKWQRTRKQVSTNAGEVLGRGEPFTLLAGVWTGVATGEISVVVYKKT